jgi:hypothetical protein
MTGDESAIGTKLGITFTGKWVWGMKDFIDTGFMKLFDPNYLFKDYATKGTSEPLENDEAFECEKNERETTLGLGPMRAKVAEMDAKTAGGLLSCGQEETEFHERFMILMRMHNDAEFTEEVKKYFKPPYLI